MNKKSTVWLPQKQLFRHAISTALRSWLLYAPSMTARMRQYGGKVSIEVLSSKTCNLPQHEAHYLSVASGTCALLREVHMYCDNDLWLYGRTLLPKSFINGPFKRVRCLGNTPLGKLLFNIPGIQRSPFEITQLMPADAEYQRSIRQHNIDTTPLWARRSLFSLNNNKASLTEVYLPAMLEYIAK